MGTSNFHKMNASSYFVMECAEDFEYEDHIDNVYDRMGELAKEKGYSISEGGSVSGKLRSFPSNPICTLKVEKRFGDMYAYVTLVVIARSGYYEHMNIDHEVEGETDDFYYSDMNAGLAHIQERNANRYIEVQGQRMVQEVEEVLKRITTPYGVTARFSNGETIYHEVK